MVIMMMMVKMTMMMLVIMMMIVKITMMILVNTLNCFSLLKKLAKIQPLSAINGLRWVFCSPIPFSSAVSEDVVKV